MRLSPALLALLALPLAADEIVLADGRVIEGEVISRQGADQLVIRISEDRMSAELRVAATQVTKITLGPTPRQTALAKLDTDRNALKAAEKPTASAWWDLSVCAKALQQRSLALELAQAAIAVDPDHAQARALLGFELVDGTWLKGADAAVARGDVLLRGVWMSPEKRDAILADEAQAATDAEERRQTRLAALEVARQKALLAAARREAQAAPEPTSYFGVTTNRAYGPSIYQYGYGGYAVPGAACVPAGGYHYGSYQHQHGPVFDLNLSGKGWSFRYRN